MAATSDLCDISTILECIVSRTVSKIDSIKSKDEHHHYIWTKYAVFIVILALFHIQLPCVQ